jgi:hypothetical protein
LAASVAARNPTGLCFLRSPISGQFRLTLPHGRNPSFSARKEPFLPPASTAPLLHPGFPIDFFVTERNPHHNRPLAQPGSRKKSWLSIRPTASRSALTPLRPVHPDRDRWIPPERLFYLMADIRRSLHPPGRKLVLRNHQRHRHQVDLRSDRRLLVLRNQSGKIPLPHGQQRPPRAGLSLTRHLHPTTNELLLGVDRHRG